MNWKRLTTTMLAIGMVLVSSQAFAIAQNLPHHNRSDVASVVKEFIPYTEFEFVTNGSTLVSMGNGTPVVAEVGGLGIGGVQMDAVAEDVHVLFPLPNNVCIDCPVNLSVLWSTDDNTTTDTATWTVLYDTKLPNTGGEILAAPASTLDTAIAADAVISGTFLLQETAQGVINAETLTRIVTLHMLVELDAVSGLDPAASTVIFHGLFIEYTREAL